MKPTRKHLKNILALTLGAFFLLGSAAQANSAPGPLEDDPVRLAALMQTAKQPWEDYDRLLKSANALATHGPELFGDTVNLYNGNVSFSVTDVSLPGNFGIPVQITRTFSVGNYPDGKPMDGAFGDWEIDLPRIEGIYGQTWHSTRCSQPTPPDVIVAGTTYTNQDFWQGLHAQMPSGGELLTPNATATKPLTSGDWKFVTAAQTYVRCLPLAGMPADRTNTTGEGFVAITPDGLIYTFSYMGQTYETPLDSPTAIASGTADLIRKKNALYVTEIRDRFENTVRFRYSNAPSDPIKLTSIEASDNRTITLIYDQTGRRIQRVTANGRPWQYVYDSSQTDAGSLSSVILPDNSSWTINYRPLSKASFLYDGDLPRRNCESTGIVIGPASAQGTVTHPAGATGTFIVRPQRHGRSNVARVCINWEFGGNIEDNDVAKFPKEAWVWKISSKTITGSAMATQEWTYSFASNGSWACSEDNSPYNLTTRFGGATCPDHSNPLTPMCTSPSCAGRATAAVSGPDNRWTRFTFGNSYRYDEGLLLKTERGSSPSNVLETTTATFALEQSGRPYPTPLGTSPSQRTDSYVNEFTRPQNGNSVSRDQVNFSWTASDFDAFARARSIQKASSLGYSRSEQITFSDNRSIWVIGQTSRVTSGGHVVQETIFDPTTAMPTERYAFGLLQEKYEYHGAGADKGQLHIIRDATNAEIGRVWDYRSGIPQDIQRPQGWLMNAEVSPFGELLYIDDPFSNRTRYTYDPMGRLNKKTFEYQDSTNWTKEETTYTGRSSGEYGLPSGLWIRTHRKSRDGLSGNREGAQPQITYEHTTWYDQMWRPVLERERDVGLAGSEKFVRTSYNAAGEVVFKSYPSSDPNSTIGVTTSFDPLGRKRFERASSELGLLTTETRYLLGHTVEVINPRGKSTLTEYMAYDTPSYEWPVVVREPTSRVTRIARDSFGKPRSITREGSYQFEFNRSKRSFVYDLHQRLCKKIDPEHGATVLDYDSAGRLWWTADGQALTNETSCDRSSVPLGARVSRSYTLRGELERIDYPDSVDDIHMTYYVDGSLRTATVGLGVDSVVRTYNYNKRRLLESESLQLDSQNLTVGYRYSPEGALSELGYPDQTWEQLSPDALGRPTRMGQYASNVEWHTRGPIKRFNYGAPGGIRFEQEINTRGLPLTRRDVWGSQAQLSERYEWDQNGNLKSVTDLVGDYSTYGNASRTLGYDDLDRLTIADSAEQPALRSITPWAFSWGEGRFEYDALDNIRAFRMARIDFSYNYDSQGRLSSISQPGEGSPMFTYGHNARGQMSSRETGGRSFSMVWDTAHRLTRTVSVNAGVSENYRYDAHGHRVKTVRASGQTVYQFYTKSGDLLWERAGTVVTKYARLNGRLIGESRNGLRFATLTDVIGSVRQKRGATGALVHEDVRAPYGSTLLGRSYQNGPSFTGHMEDGDTRLTYMKARYYDPVAMRFISPDPVYLDLSTGENYNRYWYANNNPYTYVDPDGRQAGCGTRVQGGATSHCSSTGVPTVSDTNRTNVEKLPRIVDGRASTQVVDLDGEGYESFEAAGLAGYRRFESAYFETGETEEIAGVTIMVNDRHYFTVPVLGGLENRYSLSIENAPDGAVISGRWHTHPFNGSNSFSPLDIVGVNREGGVPLLLRAGSGYVGAIYPGQGPGDGFGGVPICDMCLSPHPRYGE